MSETGSSPDQTFALSQFALNDNYHPARDAAEVLGLQNIHSSTTILDIGCGIQNLKQILPAKVVGVDLAVKDPKHPPDFITSSTALPFPDKSFDVVVNHWGGITFPLAGVDYNRVESPMTKEIVSTFLSSLREAIRVTRGEIRIHPWSISPIYELAGIVGLYDGSGGDIFFLPIDFRQLFQEMHVEEKIGTVSSKYGVFLSRLPDMTIILKRTDATTLKPIDDLISAISGIDTDKNPIVLPSTRLKRYPALNNFDQAFSSLKIIYGPILESTRLANFYRKLANHENIVHIKEYPEVEGIEKWGREHGVDFDGLEGRDYAQALITTCGNFINSKQPELDRAKEGFAKVASELQLLNR